MYNAVIFYCWHHHGDLFFAREFVKALMKIIPAKKFLFAHNNNIRAFIDIPNLGYTNLTDKMSLSAHLLVEDSIVYINTHNIGKYACAVDHYFIMFNIILNKLGLPNLPGTELDYIPEVDYTKFEIAGVNDFIAQHPEEKILICNGDVLSGQMTNFDFTPAILSIAKRHTDKCFIITKNISSKVGNVYFTGDITKTSDSFDLYEISYLSTFCTVLVGRYSGPHTCSQVKQNWLDPTKRLVTFTHNEFGNTIIMNPNVQMKKFWSPSSKLPVVISKIEEAMGTPWRKWDK